MTKIYPHSLGLYIYYSDGTYPTDSVFADETIAGADTFDLFGSDLVAGDFDSDGTIDLAVSASGQHSLYIFYNDGIYPSNATSSDIEITDTGFVNDVLKDYLVTSDFNNDGRDDLAIGSTQYNTNTGQVHIFYNDGMYPASGTEADVILTGVTSGDNFGSTLITGDFNNDGKDDLAVSASGYATSTGRTYIFYNDGSYTAYASTSDITITGDSQNDDFGYALATGDFNNDGKDDLVIGAPGYNNGADTGRIYFNETRENYAWDIQRQDLSDGIRVDPLAGYEMKITGESGGASFGISYAFGDFNNDDKDDLVVGASNYNSNQGRIYIFYNTGDYPTKAGRADVIITGESASGFGYVVTMGDMDDDGNDDLIIGASGNEKVYIFYNDGSLPTSATQADITIIPEAGNDHFGFAILSEDINGDGRDDIIVGDDSLDIILSEGRTYIFYGSTTMPTSAATADVTITGQIGDNVGFSFIVNDYNADGKNDLVIGADRFVSVYYNATLAGALSSTDADITITGTSGFGLSLIGGDYDNDGTNDIVVSSYYDAYIFYNDGSLPTTEATADVHVIGEGELSGAPLTMGDYNNDGKDDLVIGNSGYTTNTGRVYLFYNASLTGSLTATSADMMLTGETTSNGYGIALATGDLNNDGADDLVVGAIGYNGNQGRTYFYTFNDRVITGETASEGLGSSFTVGDFNNDGKNDLAVGAQSYNSYQGRTYIFYGGRKATTSVSGADIVLSGESGTQSFFGESLTTGDWNNDGIDDLAVGAQSYNSYQGRTYIFYGETLTTEDAANADIILTGESTGNSFGASLVSGDFNNDGTDDLVVGAYQWDTLFTGRVYIFYGGAMTSSGAATANVILTGEENNNSFGTALTVGDYNNDGTDDLVVGANNYDVGTATNEGATYMFYGGTIVTEGAANADAITIGENPNDYFGSTLITGDFNSDGKDDLAAGAPGYTNLQGYVYIFYGGTPIPTTAEAAQVHIIGEATGNRFAASFATGDYNNDGKDDLTVGAYGYTTNTGRTYIFYNDGNYPTSATNADAIVTGEATNSSFGNSLYSADMDNNGVDDLIIGASGYDVGTNTNEGRTYIIMSEAATTQYASYKIRGNVKIKGNVKFH